jgi:hypothetical protein
MPRYPNVPAVRMGRLAVDQNFKGQGLGAALLADALRRATTAEIAAYALVVDAKDLAAAEFYAHHGFIATSGNPLLQYLPLGTVKGLVKQRPRCFAGCLESLQSRRSSMEGITL